MHMNASPSRDCCRGRQCVQWSVSPRSNLTSTPLCSPTSEPFVEANWSPKMPSFDSPRSNLTSTPLCSPTSEPFVEANWSLKMPSFDSPMVSSPVRLLRNPVMSAKILRPVRLLRDPVISAKTKKVVPPLRKSGGQHYVDPSKFNPTYLSEHMALSIPIAKCSTCIV